MNGVVGFHKPDEDNGFLSNWYISHFQKDGMWFSSMEQYMMYHKAMVFHDEVAAQAIMGNTDVEKIKSYGRQVMHYDDVIWNGIRQIIVYEGLMAKFSQNEDLKEKLLATGEDILVECSKSDRIWGIGRAMDDERRFDISKWNGQNLLGFTLMRVRQALK